MRILAGLFGGNGVIGSTAVCDTAGECSNPSYHPRSYGVVDKHTAPSRGDVSSNLATSIARIV